MDENVKSAGRKVRAREWRHVSMANLLFSWVFHIVHSRLERPYFAV